MTLTNSSAILFGALALSFNAVFPGNAAAKAGVIGPNWISSHLELLKDAELGHSSAEQKLRDCVRTPKHCDDFETGASLILVSQKDRALAAEYARQLLRYASAPPSQRFWLADLAAQTLLLAGDDRAWRANVAAAPQPLLSDAWLLTRIGDYSLVPVIEQSLSGATNLGDHRCAAADSLDAPILHSPNGHALVDHLIDRLQDGYDISTCAAWAIRRNWSDMDQAAKQRIRAGLLALLSADDRDRNIQGVRVATVLLEKQLPDIELSSAVVRLAATAEDSMLWTEANDLATMLNLLAHPIHMSDEQREARDTIVAASGGDGLFPWEWLWQQEFDAEWAAAARLMTDAELMGFLRYGVEHRRDIPHVRAKSDALLRSGRAGDSLIGRYWLAELLTAISDRRANAVRTEVYSVADDLQQTSLATRYPKQFAAATGRVVWATALEHRDDWRYVAALANAADFCHIPGVTGGKRLRDPDVMPAYARVLANMLGPCLFNIEHNAGISESMPVEGIASDVVPMPDAVYPALQHGGIIVEFHYISAKSIPREALHVSLDGTEFTRDCFLTTLLVICDTNATLTPGQHRVDAIVGHLRKAWSFEAASPPTISELLPKGGTRYELTDHPIVRAKFCTTRALQKGDLSASFDRTDVTSNAAIKMADRHCGTMVYTPELPLAVGNHLFEMEVVGTHELTDRWMTNFIIEPAREYSVEVLSPACDDVTHHPYLLVKVAVSGNRSDPSVLTVNGDIARVRSFDEHPWVYIADVALTPGINELDIRATFEDGESRAVQQRIRYDSTSAK